ncbi:hypothetical protein AA0313_1476 [Acetobacter indonesiensis NRIC 0313]|uniref:Uncharacterized protein n=1 Tax=Acetobacter indonesiensis TaxID=104101 RepID=A0A6N3T5K5_9PROT|nr:hypothetical protein Abin_016_045 [Acetobacter indonesiensis]GBQ57483.1 hypothetical protein AA0313_1476 [Acetobacter indonesiensis NRIC 0313]GEN04482.1 hypothetical protein AIN02nite_25070 [Acetobacter indonesiensis]
MQGTYFRKFCAFVTGTLPWGMADPSNGGRGGWQLRTKAGGQWVVLKLSHGQIVESL